MLKSALPAVLALASLATAQTSCGTLAVTGTGAPGTQLTVALTGATANGFAVAFVGPTTGTTTLRLPTTTLTLGLDHPFVPVMLGPTDATGAASLVVNLPPTIPQVVQLNAQAATISFTLRPFALTGCTSNVVAFSIG